MRTNAKPFLTLLERLNARLYNALADAEPLGPKQNSSKIDSRNKIKSLRRRSSPSPGPPGHPDLAAIWRLKRLTLLDYSRKGKLC